MGFSIRMQPELKARSGLSKRLFFGVSCRYTEWGLGSMNLMRPNAFRGPGS